MLSQFFEISTSQIPKALWSYLCGHRTLSLKRSNYLANSYESSLAEEVDENLKKHMGMTMDQIVKRVHTTNTNSKAHEIKVKVEIGLPPNAEVKAAPKNKQAQRVDSRRRSENRSGPQRRVVE